MLVIIKVAPYSDTLRYVISVCGLLYVALFGLMSELAWRIPAGRAVDSIVAVLAAAMMVAGYADGVPCLYLEDWGERIDSFVAEGDMDGIVIYDDAHKSRFDCCVQEIRCLDDVIFLTEGSVAGFDYGYVDSGSVVVYMDMDYV